MKKSAILSLTLLSFIYVINACKKVEESETDYLQIKVTPKSTFILPLEDLTKCSSATTRLSANVVEFSGVTLTWSSTTSSFQLLSMTLTGKSPILSGGSYSCPIAGNELVALMPTRTIAAVTSGATSTISSTTFCSLRCGGIAVNSDASSGTVNAQIKILGVETSTADGTQIPITQTAEVTLNYKKF